MSDKKRYALNEKESKVLLKEYGVPVIREKVALNENQAVELAAEIGFPVVLKGLGASLLHKTERGLVHLNLGDTGAVLSAARSVAAEAVNELEGFLIQPQISGRREFVAGMFRDEQFGPVVMFGVGGILTEAISDVAFRLAPMREADASEMLSEIRAKKLLDRFRGENAANREKLIQTLTGLSRLAENRPDIAEIDINPLLIAPDGDVCAVDALVVVDKTPEKKEFPPPVDTAMIRPFFYPKSIAFVGASAQLGKWGHILLTITLSGGYRGEIYLVNPKGGTIAGRKVYTSVSEIPGNVDMAVVTIPASGVPELIPLFKEKGIQSMLLITSGFAETGDAGRKLEEELVKYARTAGITVLGPNTMGICNPHIGLYMTGSHVKPLAGSTAMVAQSGNMGTQLLGFAEQQGIGIRGFAGSGNEGMITIEDYIEAFETDPLTRTVMLYIESVKNGRRFLETARRIGRKKPIVLLKGGRTSAGSRAAASHTGALTSDARVFDAVCRQAGIVQVEYPMDLLDLSAAFSSLPLPKGNRVAIMTLGGGWGVVTADLCAEYGLEVPELASDIVSRIDHILPPYWSRSNPVDIVGENDNTIAITVLEEILKWEGCDAVINLGIIGRRNLLGRYMDSILKTDPDYSKEFLEFLKNEVLQFESHYVEHIVNLMKKYEKPVFGVSILTTDRDQTLYRVASVETDLKSAPATLINGEKQETELNGIFYPTPERAVKSLAKMVRYRQFLERES